MVAFWIAGDELRLDDLRRPRQRHKTAKDSFNCPDSNVPGAARGLRRGELVRRIFGNIGELRRASVENGQLRQQVEQMQTELRDTRERAAQAQRLEQLFKLTENSTYKTVVANVIARDPSMWFDGVTIDKGRWAGVEVNMPVVAPGGIVGRVISTSPLSAQVMLVTDEKAGAGGVVGQLGQSNAMGSIKGLGELGLLEMRYVSGLEKSRPATLS